MSSPFQSANVFAICRTSRLRLIQCPPFLFILLGFATIVSMLATYLLASRYTQEPEMAALVVTFVAAIFLVMGNLIINGFHRIAEANQIKSEFISLVSHQLRSPLSIFKWTLDLLEREARGRRAAEALTTFTPNLRDTTETMVRLVNSLLEVSRIEAQTFVLHREAFSLTAVTERVLGELRTFAESSQITLALESAADLPPAWGDAERAEIVVWNLVDNAIRYTPHAGKIQIAITRKDRMVRWAIHDQGIGIPAVEQKRVFEKFFRAQNIQASQVRGTGIGLFMSKAIVEASGGRMGFESEEGKGSTFWFTVPIAPNRIEK